MELACYIIIAFFSVFLAYLSAKLKMEYVDQAEKENASSEEGQNTKDSKADSIESKECSDNVKKTCEEALEDSNSEEQKRAQKSETSVDSVNNTSSLAFALVMLVLFAIAAILMFAFRYKTEQHVFSIAQYIVLWDCICVIAVIDFKVKKIPTLLIWIAAGARICGIIAELIVRKASIQETILFSFIGAVIGGGIIAICKLFAKNGVGWGDIRLFALIGLFLGLAGLMNVMFYTMFIAAITGIVLIVSKKAAGKSLMAMAPFVFIGLNLYLFLLY